MTTEPLYIDKENLNIIVLEILSWLKLENKRSIWIAQGRKACLKPLQLNMQYPWCTDLCMLVEKEKLFQEYFSIKEGKFNFSDLVTEDIKIKARELAYKNYNPQKHT
ncbi:hypothetical protein [Roseburia sp. 499]|uniref:hypothetical protein n=1 Tax=Roseburia sp. 499 TaxID=1261634 RepID=UPI000950D46C|nr:hypothetical protein [Roseburia sp. 499]WVK69462.1 hypothetical protein BIV20_14040 [Roseburia sp. 499]